MLNFVICDDNLNILDRLDKMLNIIFTKKDFDAKIAFKSDDSDELLKYIACNNVDVVILDINLKSNKSGLDIAERIRKINKDVYLIFMTAHLEYVMVAYKYKTFDYIAKPINYDRLEETVVRLFEDINGIPKRYIKIDSKNTLVDEAQIQFIKRDAMKLVFHTQSRDYEAYSSFNKLQGKLPDNFIRCHKSFIANINQIKDVEPVAGKITFKDGHICDIGPKYKSNLLEVLNNYGTFE